MALAGVGVDHDDRLVGIVIRPHVGDRDRRSVRERRRRVEARDLRYDQVARAETVGPVLVGRVDGTARRVAPASSRGSGSGAGRCPCPGQPP